MTHRRFPTDAMGNIRAGVLPKQQQRRGQGVPVLVYRFPQNTSFLIFVYLRFTLAGASAIWSKRHSRAQITCDVSEMLIRRQRGKTSQTVSGSGAIRESFHSSLFSGECSLSRIITLKAKPRPRDSAECENNMKQNLAQVCCPTLPNNSPALFEIRNIAVRQNITLLGHFLRASVFVFKSLPGISNVGTCFIFPLLQSVFIKPMSP